MGEEIKPAAPLAQCIPESAACLMNRLLVAGRERLQIGNRKSNRKTSHSGWCGIPWEAFVEVATADEDGQDETTMGIRRLRTIAEA